jgi:hypothetical protein
VTFRNAVGGISVLTWKNDARWSAAMTRSGKASMPRGRQIAIINTMTAVE